MWQRSNVVCKAQNIYYLALYRKSVPTPDLDNFFQLAHSWYVLYIMHLRLQL